MTSEEHTGDRKYKYFIFSNLLTKTELKVHQSTFYSPVYTLAT